MAPGAQRFDDLFSEFGPIILKRFFGGEGIYAGDVMIGMVFDDVIYFTTDETTRKLFTAEKCKPFTFEKRSTGETVVTHWYAIPDRLYDDPEDLALWAKRAFGVAANSQTTRRKQARSARSKRAQR